LRFFFAYQECIGMRTILRVWSQCPNLWFHHAQTKLVNCLTGNNNNPIIRIKFTWYGFSKIFVKF
jgi:hypothetical protein